MPRTFLSHMPVHGCIRDDILKTLEFADNQCSMRYSFFLTRCQSFSDKHRQTTQPKLITSYPFLFLPSNSGVTWPE